MPWLNATNKKIQAFHWVPSAGLAELSFMEGGGLDPAEATRIDFLELSGQQQTSRSIKFNMITPYADGEDRTAVYSLWFADSPEELEESILNDTPANIVSSSYGQDPLPLFLSFDVSTRYMAINFDGTKSNFVPEFTSISIYVC
jgi:hypothetical protein